MYNGVGLQTARGSGGSGYVQKNLSVNTYKKQSKDDFLKDLQQMRKNNLPPPRKANQQIVQHQRKRQILIQTIKLRQKLQSQGLNEQQIEERVKKAQQILKNRLEKGQMQTKAKQTHVLTQAKEKQYMKLSKAFGLKVTNEVGSSFHFEKNKDTRLKNLEQKRLKSQFKCPHQDCEKTYHMQQYLDRHLKYKHPKQKIAIEHKKQL